MLGMSDLEVVREGPVQFFSKGIGNSWKSRYLVITRAGVCDIFTDETKKKRHNKKKGGGFHLQGGETVEVFEPKDKTVNYAFQVVETKKTWQFATENEKLRDEWIIAFKNVLKQLNALIHLQKVMNKPNHNTLEGKLEFADALAKCGQLAKARRIFSKLIVDFNDNKAHRGYEEFLVKSCHDVYQAESHFLRRIKFFVVPTTFLDSREGQQFSMIAHRISFFDTQSSTSKNDKGGLDEQKERQLESILPDVIKHAQARNLENDWPFYLYKVDNGFMDEAKALIKSWIKRTNYTQRKFEYSYEEIETRVWDVMYNCSVGKKGITRLDFRLKAVMQDKKDKLADSHKALAPIDLKDSILNDENKENAEIEPAPSDTMASSANPSNNNNNNTNNNSNNNNNNEVNDIDETGDGIGPLPGIGMAPRGKPPDIKRGPSQSVVSDAEMEHLDNLVGDILGDYEFSDHENSSDDNDNDTDNKSNDNNNNNDDDEKKIDPNDLIINSVEPTLKDPGAISLLAADTFGMLGMDSNRGYDTNDLIGFARAQLADAQASAKMKENTHFFTTVSEILDNKDNHIFPWTAFMLVWMMRRDNMTHIGGNSANENQIRAVLEFVYLFTRGCFCALQDHWEYTLLLTSLYHNAVDGKDPEDVKQKLCLQAVSVIGDENIPFSNKKLVFDFLRENLWLQYNQENVHKATTRNFFLKGIKVELKRIQDELNEFYDKYVYNSKIYASIVPINDKNKVSPVILRQDNEKVQGKCTWGPRKNNKYDRSLFKDVCANRNIVAPKPTKNEGNFDEAYLLFCIELAKELDPYFQKTVRKSITTEIPTATHYPAQIKSFERAYHKITHDLQHLQSPRASRLVDYCRCVIGFKSLIDLKRGFSILEKTFRLCKIVNTFANKKQINVENYQYIDVYVLAEHPKNQFNKLICEIRLTMQRVRDLDFERRIIRDCFENNKVLSAKEIASIMKDIAREARKQDKLSSMGAANDKEPSKSRSKKR